MSKKSKISKSKSSLVLLKAPKVDREVPGLTASVVQAPATKVSMPEITTSSIVPKADPLRAVTDIPEKIAAENAGVVFPTPANPDPGKVAASLPKVEAVGKSPWDYPAKLMEMTQVNTKFVSTFANRFVAAKSPQDLLNISSDFSKEGGLLFKEQSQSILKMFAL